MSSTDQSRSPLAASHDSVLFTPPTEPSTRIVISHSDYSMPLAHQSISPQPGTPDLPPRPSSALSNGHDSNTSGPPSPLLEKPTQRMGNLSLQGVSSNAISSPDHADPDPNQDQDQQKLHEDEKTSSRASRFVGNMLVTRIGRASWQSLESTARLPFYLSPWGDNHPFTLPNLRKRDLALAGVAHFGLDALGASAVTVVQHAVSATVEQGAHEGLEKLNQGTKKGQQQHVVRRGVGVNTLTLRIRHKLIGEAAELVFRGVRDTDDRMACAKGWFCPYLYASGREPEIARAKNFAMAQLLTPRLAADASIAPTLLSSFGESDTPVLSPFGCPWEDPSFKPGTAYPRFRRMALFVTGISPYRYITTQSAWSHSRIPNEARISFHLFTHVPAIVIPVKDQSPILGWSPWTVAQMLENKTRYDIDRHVTELLDFVESVIDEEALRTNTETAGSGWRDIMERALRPMLDAILNAPDAVREASKECCELERTGLVAFRY